MPLLVDQGSWRRERTAGRAGATERQTRDSHMDADFIEADSTRLRGFGNYGRMSVKGIEYWQSFRTCFLQLRVLGEEVQCERMSTSISEVDGFLQVL